MSDRSDYTLKVESITFDEAMEVVRLLHATGFAAEYIAPERRTDR